jgi:hypothetical protein
VDIAKGPRNGMRTGTVCRQPQQDEAGVRFHPLLGKVSANPWQDENNGTPRHHGAKSDWARGSNPTLDTMGCGSVGQANAALTPFGGLPVEPSDGRSEFGSSDPVKLVLRGIDHFHCVPLLGLIGEGGQRYRRRSREFLSALRRHLPGEERAKVCWACAAIVGTCL